MLIDTVSHKIATLAHDDLDERGFLLKSSHAVRTINLDVRDKELVQLIPLVGRVAQPEIKTDAIFFRGLLAPAYGRAPEDFSHTPEIAQTVAIAVARRIAPVDRGRSDARRCFDAVVP
jgi:hypothetical protein